VAIHFFSLKAPHFLTAKCQNMFLLNLPKRLRDALQTFATIQKLTSSQRNSKNKGLPGLFPAGPIRCDRMINQPLQSKSEDSS
jgi:hypothetical protein